MTRRIDTIEAATNAIVGIGVSVAVVHVVWPLMGWPVTTGQSLSVSLLFFVLSTARSYALRRIFRRIGNGRLQPR